ncbi:MAG: aldehyde dehydrogenase family protein [Burkholderiales bacterium]
MSQGPKSTQGMLELGELRELVARGEIETVVVGFTDHYGRLLGKRFDAEMFVDDVVDGGAHSCDYLLTIDMEMDPVPGYRFASWELGYGDFHLVPDLQTLRVASWLERSAFVLCDLRNEKTHECVSVAPRSILRRQLGHAKALAYGAYAASELEHYLFRRSYREAHEQDYRDLAPGGWYLEDYHILQGTRTEDFHGAVRRHLKRSGVPVENSKGEWGPGQHELNVRFAEALEAADRHVVFKQCMKEVADAMGVSVTFMAKFASGQAGSSCHIHLSMWRDQENAFAGGNDSRYGLTASVWTEDRDAALRIGERIATGTVFMNRCDYLDPALAWTGVKDSGRGCTLSKLGLETFTRPKSFHLRLKI